MYQVVLADDQSILNESLKVIIEQDKELKVIGMAENGLEACQLCDELAPDLVLMDLHMPVCDGIESTGLIKKKHPEIKILVLTTFSDPESIHQALKNGADGYLLKNIKSFELREAIKSTMRGLNVIKEDIFSTMVQQLDLKPENPKTEEPTVDLTTTEILIIQKIVQGQNNKAIADTLGYSESRVKAIIRDIFAKLNIEDRIQLAVYAVKHHLC